MTPGILRGCGSVASLESRSGEPGNEFVKGENGDACHFNHEPGAGWGHLTWLHGIKELNRLFNKVMLGGGFLKQMNDTIKYNRDILGKRKTISEIHKEESRKKSGNYESARLHDVQERVARALRRNETGEQVGRIISCLTLIALFTVAIWYVSSTTFTRSIPGRYQDPEALFTRIRDHLANGLVLESHYFRHGSKASQTHFKNNMKHQNSESFYESGAQFRSALYFEGDLIREVYYFRSGAEIPNFPQLAPDKVYHIRLKDPQQNTRVEFDVFDGKILPGSYSEATIPRNQNSAQN